MYNCTYDYYCMLVDRRSILGHDNKYGVKSVVKAKLKFSVFRRLPNILVESDISIFDYKRIAS